MNSRIKNALLGVAMTAVVASAVPADAVTFNLIPAAGAAGAGVAAGTQARKGFEIATAYWSSVLTDNITINLTIGFSTLGANILGSTGSTRTTVYDTAYYTALTADRSSTLDYTAVANLRPLTAGSGATTGTGAVTAITNALNAAGNGYVDTATKIDNDGSANNRGIALNTTVAKALGITNSYTGAAINYGASDGSVQFSDAFTFDFDPSDGIASNAYDFIGVAIHEIGHALGFVSGVDTYDAYTSPGSANTNPGGLENFINIASQLDLFRYSSAGNLDWSTQNTPYFSIDGGVSQLFGNSLFSTGVTNGDGRQASHWKDSAFGQPQLGILDPTSGLSQMQEVTALDLAAYDAIGYQSAVNVLANPSYRYSTAQIYAQFATPVPEPTTWAMMIAGFAMVGGAMRRRSTKVAFA